MFSLSPSVQDALHIALDTGIGLSYVGISITLLVFWRRVRQQVPSSWAFLAFAAFIVSCGSGHFAAALGRLLAGADGADAFRHGVDSVTLVASLATALALPPLVPYLTQTLSTARRAQDEARQRAKLEGVLLASRTLQHELNNRLALTAGYAEILLADPGLPKHLREATAETLRGARESARVVNQIQQLSTLEEQDWGPGIGATLRLDPETVTAGEPRPALSPV